MKRIFSYIALLSVSLSVFTACKKMDSTYREFIVPGGITYTGKANNIITYPGYKRIKLSWLRGSDPSIVKARVFWNNYTDSVEVTVPQGADTISTIINDLPENSYSFIIKTYDSKGNSSVPAEVVGASYGEDYQISLLTRIVGKSVMDDQGVTTIKWGTADISNGAFATEVKYTDNNGQTKNVIFSVNDTASVIPDIKSSATSFQYRTLFVPSPLAIDTFYTDYVSSRLLGQRVAYPKTGWTISSNAVLRAGNEPENAIDGSSDSYWWTGAGSSNPYTLTIDMGEQLAADGISLQQSTRTDPRLLNFELQVSLDGSTWESIGLFDMADNLNVQNFDFSDTKSFRYFKIIGNTIYRDKTNCSLAEVGVYQR